MLHLPQEIRFCWRRKRSSLQHHIANVHSWVGATKFVKCAHEDLPEDSSTQWLASGYAQHTVACQWIRAAHSGLPVDPLNTQWLASGSAQHTVACQWIRAAHSGLPVDPLNTQWLASGSAQHAVACQWIRSTRSGLPVDPRSTQWLASGSAQHAALIKIMSDGSILADSVHLTQFRHTAPDPFRCA